MFPKHKLDYVLISLFIILIIYEVIFFQLCNLGNMNDTISNGSLIPTNGFSTSEDPQELIHLRLSHLGRLRNLTPLGPAPALG